MFTVGLDHLHILFMLIVAFFSFRAYNNNALAIEYEQKQEYVEQGNREEDQDMEQVGEKIVESSQMNEEAVEDQNNVETLPVEQIVQVGSSNSIDAENANSADLQSDFILGQNQHNEVNTVQGSLDRIDDESVAINPSESLEKEQDQESTILNRIENRFSQEPCDEEDDAECSSSSDDSSNSSSGHSGFDNEDEKRLSRRQKRKRIQKAKRVEKKLRREKERFEKQVELVEIQ